MVRVSRCSLFSLGCLLMILSGCSSGPIEGQVQLDVICDNEPLKAGAVRFVPVDGKSPTSGGPITDGKFSGNVPIGEMKVEITGSKVVGKRKVYDTPESPTVEIVEELVDEKYNLKSELTMTVVSGVQTKKFEVKSVGKK
jgi:hypothetical protein